MKTLLVILALVSSTLAANNLKCWDSNNEEVTEQGKLTEATCDNKVTKCYGPTQVDNQELKDYKFKKYGCGECDADNAACTTCDKDSCNTLVTKTYA